MPPLMPLDTWSSRGPSAKLRPRARCFIVAEGANTEFWYLSSLAYLLSKKNLPERIEIKPIEKTGDDKNMSHPRALAKQATIIREDKTGEFGFDDETDRVVIVFDADVYKGDEGAYLDDLRDFEKVAQVAVTNPSFELFMLLHEPGSFERVIEPNREAILENGYVEGTKRRFVSKLANQVLGMNLKKNPRVARLAERFETAAGQETRVNQDPRKAIGRLTSNVAMTIENLIREGQQQ